MTALLGRQLLSNSLPHPAEDLLHIGFEDAEVVGDQLLVIADDVIDAAALFWSQVPQMIDRPAGHLEAIPERLGYFNFRGAAHQQAAGDNSRRENDDSSEDDQADFPEAHHALSPSSADARMVCSRSCEKLPAPSASPSD